MASPMSDYSGSQDSKDFLFDYKRRIASDPRLEFHQDIVKDFGESYERAYQLWNTYYAEAYKDLSYYLGNQWSLEELAYLNNQRRSSFTYNKIRRIINLIQGYQRKNRMATILSPVEDASQETATILTDTMQHIMESADGYSVISDAFKGALTTGISFVSPYVDYRDDPVSGDIKFHLDEWNAIILDPFFTKRDLTDCSFVARRKFLGRTDVISLIPDKEDVINALPWGSRDDKFTYMPYARQWGMQKLLNYTEYWRSRWETKDVLVDMETGETREWDGDKKRLRMYREAFPQIKVIKKPVRSVELGIIVEGELLYYGKDPSGLNEYPFVPFFCTFEPSYDLYNWKIQSLVRLIRDPQTELNKRRSKMVDIIDGQLNTGWIAKTGAVTNNASLFKSGAGQVIFLKPEANMADIQKIDPPGIHPSLFQLEAEFAKDMVENVGISPENLGMSENENIETAAILAKSRQAAGLVNLQDVFDGLRDSQKLLGRKTAMLMQLNYTPEKIRLITKKEPTPEFYSKTFAKYDVVVEEGVLTDTQRHSQFIQLTALRQMGVLPPEGDALIIKNSNLHDTEELAKLMEQKAKAQAEAQSQIQQLQMQEMAIRNKVAESRSEADLSLAAERLNKVQLDAALSAERISRSQEDRTAGVLNLVKAAKELDGMDLDHLMREIEIIRELEGQQVSEEQKNAPSQAKPSNSSSQTRQAA